MLAQEAEPAVGAATGTASLAWLLIAAPAFGALVLFLAGRRADRWGHWLGVATVVASFVIGLLIFLETIGLAPGSRTRELSLYGWIASGSLNVDFGLRLDPLSLTFVLLVTGVGGLIHLYSVGYMAPHEPTGEHAEPSDPSARRRFFAQLNLFVAAMLVLVLANNFVLLYLGWEGVGLASYLLIGFYQDRPSAATAAKKAF
ncbi:MAG: NADH-quinone oxidoreductase subunit L, partial [Pseudonocardia sp.]|nr:NADH-quinone oxidoreductase subunit L [Pseudonocardia sp.]